MCDPITATVIGVVGSLGSAFMSYSQQQSLMKNQEAANASWAAYQRQKAAEEGQRQEAARQRAEAARQDTLGKVDAGSQKEAQQTEQSRLEQEFQPQVLRDPQSLNDMLLTGQGKNVSPVIQTDVANRITQASKDARARIANLATIQSYGGSQFGLQNRAQDLFNQSGQNIRLQGDIRQGSLAAFGVEKNVQPLQYAASPSPWGGIAGALAGIAGKAGTSIGGSPSFSFNGAPVAANTVSIFGA